MITIKWSRKYNLNLHEKQLFVCKEYTSEEEKEINKRAKEKKMDITTSFCCEDTQIGMNYRNYKRNAPVRSFTVQIKIKSP